ncbi:MAG: helix-turn-helix transcriptional regulator [Oscillospiraceae bacterium]
MDNGKTGLFIRELRTARSMTQKGLAEQLHITDKAVSKWERGLCAPDIALLEPLAGALGTTVTALIAGEAGPVDRKTSEIEENVQNAIRYSASELICKTKRASRRGWIISGLCALCAAALCLGILWWRGNFNILERVVSPDGTQTLTVYDRDVLLHEWSGTPDVAIAETGRAQYNAVYRNCTYGGAYWSPDSTKYVLALEGLYGEPWTHLLLVDETKSSSSNLNASLSSAVEASAMGDEEFRRSEDGMWPIIDYRFLQWSRDSRAMLIDYAFEDTAGATHSGYFWYSPADGTVRAVLVLED